MVICLVRCADLHMAQLMPLPLTVSCFSKIQMGFTFLVPAHPGRPGQGAVKRVCVCVCVISYHSLDTWSHAMSTHMSPHRIEPQCCFNSSYCMSESVFSVVLYCSKTILMCLLIFLYAFLDQLERGADLYTAQLMPLPLTVSCFSKSRLVLPVWYRLTLVVPDKGPLNVCCSSASEATATWRFTNFVLYSSS